MSFKSEVRPKQYRIGEKIAKILSDPSTLNAPAQEIATVKQHLARNLGSDPFDWPIVDHFFAKVYDSGASPAYPYEPRYELKRVRPKWSLEQDDLLSFEDD